MLNKNKKTINDIIIWLIIIFLISISLFSFYYFSNYLILTRIFLLLLIIFVIFLLFIKTYLGKLLWSYVLEAFKEINFITWPSRKDTIQTTLIISVIVFVMGLILCSIDLLFFKLIVWVANFDR